MAISLHNICGSSRKRQGFTQMDRISNLPDSVLSHILSLLSTKLAVSTSVLSKRWQFLWTTVHNFHFDCTAYESKKVHTSFDNFVNRFFTQRDKKLCIKRFCLDFQTSWNPTDVDSWVHAVLSSDVEELDLHFSINKRFWFRSNIFTSKTLVVLKLGGPSIAIDGPHDRSSIYFPSLKVLHLLGVKFTNHTSFGNLLSSCPVLESMVFRGVYYDSREFSGYVISSPTLKELVMKVNCRWTSVLVEAPSLEYLNLELDESTGIFLKNFDNLLEAVVNVQFDYDFFDEVKILHMFGAFSNVQVLKLEQSTIQDIHYVSFKDFPVFHNLVRLEFDGFCCFWPTLLSLLQKLPYLQQLTIRYILCPFSSCQDFGTNAWAELDVLNCLSRLRTLCFYGAFDQLEGDSDLSCDDLEFVIHVMKNSTVLETMTITCWSRLSLFTKHAFRQKLASLERGSKKCELKFEGEIL